MTQVPGTGTGGGAAARGAPLGDRRRHPPAVPGAGGGGHHPGDRPGGRHRRRHHLPGLRRQDRAPRRGHRGRARPRAHRGRHRAPSTRPSSFEDRLIAAVEILRQRVLYVFHVLSAASGTTARRDSRRSTRSPRAHRDLRVRSRAPAPARRPTPHASCAVSRSRACTRPSAPTNRSRRTRSSRCCSTASAAPTPRRRRADPADPRVPVQVPEVADPRPRLPDDPVRRDADPPDAERQHHRQHREQGPTQLHLEGRRRDARRHLRPGRVRDRGDVLRRALGHGVRARRAPRPVPHRDGLLGTRGRPVRRTVADHPHHQRRHPGAGLRADDAARCSSPRRS